jgi:hypothetical protein
MEGLDGLPPQTIRDTRRNEAMTHAWVIRSGSHGERDAWALESSCSGGGWGEVEDLTECSTRDDVARATAKAYAGAADGKLANFTGQLWALRGRIEPGDLMVMPMKTTKQIALGRVTGSYEYRAGEQDANKRHVVAVDWQRTDLRSQPRRASASTPAGGCHSGPPQLAALPHTDRAQNGTTQLRVTRSESGVSSVAAAPRSSAESVAEADGSAKG